MKGTLHKTESGWIVIYDEVLGKNIVKKNQNALPLHPDDVKQIVEDSKIFDNIEARIAAYPDVLFYILEECPHFDHFGKDCSCKSGFIKYAKLKEYSLSKEDLDTLFDAHEDEDFTKD